jgi:alanyl-tRNA synthetase
MLLMVTKDLTDRFDPNSIMKELAAQVNGTGGGRKEAGGRRKELRVRSQNSK